MLGHHSLAGKALSEPSLTAQKVKKNSCLPRTVPINPTSRFHAFRTKHRIERWHKSNYPIRHLMQLCMSDIICELSPDIKCYLNVLVICKWAYHCSGNAMCPQPSSHGTRKISLRNSPIFDISYLIHQWKYIIICPTRTEKCVSPNHSVKSRTCLDITVS